MVKPSKKPMIPRARKLKRLGFERTINVDGTPGKLKRVGLNPVEKKVVTNWKRYVSVENKKNIPTVNLKLSEQRLRNVARTQRRIKSYVERCNEVLKSEYNKIPKNKRMLSDKYTVEDVYQNSLNLFLRQELLRSAESGDHRTPRRLDMKKARDYFNGTFYKNFLEKWTSKYTPGKVLTGDMVHNILVETAKDSLSRKTLQPEIILQKYQK